MGYSLGTAVSINLACEKNEFINGLILLAPPLSVLRTYKYINEEDTFYFDMFNSIQKVENIKVNTIIIHGKKDTFISCNDGYNLYNKIPQEYQKGFFCIDKANHTDIFEEVMTYEKINSFIKINENLEEAKGTNQQDENLIVENAESWECKTEQRKLCKEENKDKLYKSVPLKNLNNSLKKNSTNLDNEELNSKPKREDINN